MRYERAHPKAPWLTAAAIALLEDWLRSTDCGLEWGAGRSTLWFASRVQNLISVESDQSWYSTVEGKLRDGNIHNVTLHYASVDHSRKQPGDQRYVQIGAELPNSCLDFVLVDGTLRELCALAVLDKLKPSGLLIIDNANWFLRHRTYSPASVYSGGNTPSPVWLEVADRLKNWRSIWTSNGVTDTAFFIKPNAESAPSPNSSTGPR